MHIVPHNAHGLRIREVAKIAEIILWFCVIVWTNEKKYCGIFFIIFTGKLKKKKIRHWEK